ncbi:MAG: tRNA (N(6)-L-threonylcarbamoyladenosine(37)-C(2))-methylthiotransferase MtaB [Treponema sp.]|nr:tRNA (N(6)-L-threonylcarbamoyladenosine(37)-C(2))-methylthiotransferase MtaB [Treponema sp.]
MKTVQIETLGCRLNQIESEAAARFFEDAGFSVKMSNVTSQTDEDLDTVLCILNTCTVTQKAEQKARRIIRLLLKKYPEALLIVTGCYAQLAGPEIEKMDEKIVALGGQIKSRISEVPSLLLDFLKGKEWSVLDFKEIVQEKIITPPVFKPFFPEDSFKLSTTSFLSHSRASLKIQDGCNNNCSYCAIHKARGKSVSIDVNTAVKRVQELEAAGHQEVVITTVNIGQYRGKYIDESCNGAEVYFNFSKLLEMLLKKTEKIRFRISSLYPEVVDEDFCRVVSDDRVCPHFHISVQSGSNKVLRAMNRVYAAEAVVAACEKLRKVKENPFIACDIITGFPGETDEDFEQTKKLCEKCNFTWIHAFPYSERPGTLAAEMKNKVPQNVSGERAKWLSDFAVEHKIKYIEECIGKKYPAVLETTGKTQGDMLTCVTSNFLHCVIDGQYMEDGKQSSGVVVEIKSALKGKIIKGGELEAIGIIV